MERTDHAADIRHAQALTNENIMQITKHETVDVEVKVDVSIADVVGELPVTAENLQEALRGFNVLLAFAKSLPDALVSELNPKQREIISTNLTALVARLATLPLPTSGASPGDSLVTLKIERVEESDSAQEFEFTIVEFSVTGKATKEEILAVIGEMADDACNVTYDVTTAKGKYATIDWTPEVGKTVVVPTQPTRQ